MDNSALLWDKILIMKKSAALDATDWRIVELLQKQADLPIHLIAERVGLTTNPCWRRIKRLEADGVIVGRRVVVSQEALGLRLTAFMTLRTAQHDAQWLAQFAATVADMPEIVECHRMSGATDYLLKIVVTEISHYDRVYQKLITRLPSVVDVSSNFSMEQIKNEPVLTRPVYG